MSEVRTIIQETSSLDARCRSVEKCVTVFPEQFDIIISTPNHNPYNFQGHQSSDLFHEYKCVEDPVENAIQDFVSNKRWTHKKHFLFLQSSGYGKTRICMNLLKRRPGIFLMCGSVANGFAKCKYIDDLITQLKYSKDMQYQKKVVESFIHTMVECIKRVDSVDELFRLQFDEENYLYHSAFKFQFNSPEDNDISHLSVDGNWSRNSSSTTVSTNIESISTPKSTPSAFHQRLVPPYVLVFDEAHGLEDRVITLIKQALDAVDNDVIGIFVSTMGKVHQCLPEQMHSRDTGLIDNEPIYQLRSFDLYREHILTLGRPLWYGYLTSRCGSAFGRYNRLVMFALKKLLGPTTIDDCNAKLSLFLCRFGGFQVSSFEAASHLVRHHMATFTRIDNDVKRVGHIRYPSEPILAEASAYCTSGLLNASVAYTKVSVIQAVASHLKESTRVINLNVGDLGELMSCCAVGFTLDIIRAEAISVPAGYLPEKAESSMHSAVSAMDFLKAICPQNLDQDLMDLSEYLDGYCTNANHFIRLPYRPSLSTCMIAIKRGAAVITKEYSRGLDFFVEFFKHPVEIDNKDSRVNDVDKEPRVESEMPVEELRSYELLSPAMYFKGYPVYQSKKGAYVYYKDGARRYISEKDRLKMEAMPPVASDPGQKKLYRRSGEYDNIHFRFSVKNYSNSLSRNAAEKFLYAVDEKCDPADAVTDSEGENLLITVLINMGTGLLSPFIQVVHSKPLRNRKNTRKHIMIALSMNHGNDSDRCFHKLGSELWTAIRDCACSRANSALEEEDETLVLGRTFEEDRIKVQSDEGEGLYP